MIIIRIYWWSLFQTYDYKRIYDNMLKPAFIFDGRLILDHEALMQIGFHVDAIGKCLARSPATKKAGRPKPWAHFFLHRIHSVKASSGRCCCISLWTCAWRLPPSVNAVNLCGQHMCRVGLVLFCCGGVGNSIVVHNGLCMSPCQVMFGHWLLLVLSMNLFCCICIVVIECTVPPFLSHCYCVVVPHKVHSTLRIIALILSWWQTNDKIGRFYRQN